MAPPEKFMAISSNVPWPPVGPSLRGAIGAHGFWLPRQCRAPPACSDCPRVVGRHLETRCTAVRASLRKKDCALTLSPASRRQ